MTAKAFEEQALPHAESLYNTALRLTRNVNDAEDLVQEVFYKAFRSINQFQPGTNMRAWLFKILVNTHISMYRKTSKDPSVSGYDDVEEFSMYSQVHSRSESLSDSPSGILDRFLEKDIRSAIDKLPEAFREVVMLVDIEGFSYKEASDILETPVGTIMSRLFRSRKLLQKYLWEYAVEYGYVKK
jgi:RNA polymerase sigma-70 factor (ECF subfamily)